MRNKIQRCMVVVAMLIGFLGIATPAKAAWSDCGNFPGTVCLFAFNGWGTPIWRQYPWQIPGCRSLVGTGWNDVTTIAVNNTSGDGVLVVWQHYDCTGSYVVIGSGTHQNFYGGPWDNQVSAVEFVEA